MLQAHWNTLTLIKPEKTGTRSGFSLKHGELRGSAVDIVNLMLGLNLEEAQEEEQMKSKWKEYQEKMEEEWRQIGHEEGREEGREEERNELFQKQIRYLRERQIDDNEIVEQLCLMNGVTKTVIQDVMGKLARREVQA